MLFNSAPFIFIFLPIVLVATRIGLRMFGRIAGVVILIAASLAFYAIWHFWAVGILLISTGTNLVMAYTMLKSKRVTVRRGLLVAGLLANVAVLCYFKYTNFLIFNLNRFSGSNIHLIQIILPLGVSFYTFQKIAFLVDVYERKITEIRPLE